ncbi:carboxymuconolactone decarboxylase [Mycobacterium sp. UM_CSW]|uniref:carboxymuconolactone decarboxylase family protein n=1 Tax=Mycobacterium sp. UM_CSW TaxID=1370119 RepID=UPI000401E24A|nr:carboxymuconolactone decarboxylase [Mycobacterium sp. UM_CSW]
MAVDGGGLGGRLRLYERAALDPAQRELFDWLTNVAVPWAEAAKFRARTDAGRLIGPFNPALLTPAISSAFVQLAVTEQTNTSLSKRCREVIILSVGAVWRAPYELYAHCAVAGQAGLPDKAVRTLADGGLPDDLTKDEAVAHLVARALSVEHRLDDTLYRAAEATLGPAGVMEAAVLTGIYHTVCAILNAFEIPAPG